MTKKLLLADDSITIQKVVGIIFATEDYQLIVADNGDDAYEKALQEYPDLVIADVAMPGKDGFELCESIKQDSRLPHTSVLLLPGTFEHFEEDRAEAVGADGWITKPFESQALLDKVKQLLESEPIRLDADAASATPSEEPAGEEAPDLGEMAEPVEAAAPPEETAPEDIWDAVSFDEEDLAESAGSELELEPTASEETEAGGEAVEEVDFSGTEELVLDESPAAAESDVWEELPEEAPLELGEAEATDFDELPAEEMELAVEEEPLELNAGEIQETEEFAATDFSPAEEPLELVEEEVAAEPEQEDLVAEEEILDLADEDILEEEPLEEIVEEPLELEEEPEYQAPIVEEPAVEEVITETAVSEEEYPTTLEEPEYQAPMVEEPAAEGEAGDEIGTQADAVEDDGFYFDDSAAVEEVAEEPGQSAVAVAPDVSASAPIEQVERQLRDLSEDELKAVVSKVAGPMIEKLAGELLAQIAWEVVPDLAEAMIREEIRKIKQGAE